MSRCMKMAWIALVVVLSAFPTFADPPVTATCEETAHRASASTKPNIVFILTDDQDLLLGTLDYMPNLKSLIADQGLSFPNDYVPLSLCCPSRTTILRGQFPHNHQIQGNSAPMGGFPKAYALSVESATVATALQGAGYRTALFGKYLNGYPDTAPTNYIPPGWSEWYSPSAGKPYSEYDYTLNENGIQVSYGSAPADYMVDVLSVTALDFIRRSTAAAQPFFVYFATYAPHAPYTPAPRHANLFPGVKAPRLPSFNEADVSDKPAYIQQMKLLTDKEIQVADASYRLRLQSLQSVDEFIAALAVTLQSLGQLDNTYIFFTSDNGYHLGEKRMAAGKYTPYETDIRVPLVVRGPGVAKGGTVAHMTSEVDFAATWAELAGTSLPVQPDGRSLVPLFKGTPPPPASWRQTVLLEQWDNGNPLAHPEMARLWREGAYAGILEPPDAQDFATEAIQWPSHTGYTTGTYKYVEYDTAEKELYLLDHDPDEVDNKAALAAPMVLGTCSAYLATLKACQGQGCAGAEGAPPPALVSPIFSFSPSEPTDVTSVTFTASAAGTPPYTFTWDLAGTPATGATATAQFPPGDRTIALRVTDAIGAKGSIAKTVRIAPTVFVDAVHAMTNPFRVKITGSNFKAGCKVLIDGWQATSVSYKSPALVKASGSDLKAYLPKGQAVQVVILNTDGSQNLPFTYTR